MSACTSPSLSPFSWLGTKFAPDWCFGLFKQLIRRSKVDSIDDKASVVDQSADINVSQLVGTQEGQVRLQHIKGLCFLSHTLHGYSCLGTWEAIH